MYTDTVVISSVLKLILYDPFYSKNFIQRVKINDIFLQILFVVNHCIRLLSTELASLQKDLDNFWKCLRHRFYYFYIILIRHYFGMTVGFIRTKLLFKKLENVWNAGDTDCLLRINFQLKLVFRKCMNVGCIGSLRIVFRFTSMVEKNAVCKQYAIW